MTEEPASSCRAPHALMQQGRPERQRRQNGQWGIPGLTPLLGRSPRLVRGAARQAAIAASLNHTVRSPRWRRPAS